MKNVAIVGCGNISEIYLKNLTETFQNVCVYAVCDLDEAKVQEKSEKYGAKIMTLEEILKDDAVDIVLNITTPAYHFAICKQGIEVKKSVYVEKPLSLTVAEGKELVELAEKNGVLLGCAPDTFMGAGIHTARKIIDDGLIGDMIGATAFMVCPGHESWHPAPEFYYQTGGGPLFDMGPYYITALINLLGAVKFVYGMANCVRKQRMITSQPQKGKMMDVEVATHVNGLLQFENGAVGNLMMSFDVYGSQLPRIEVYGTKGSVIVPDPNTFGGDVLLKQSFDKEFHTVPLINRYSANSRGLGVSDMAYCMENDSKENCASGTLALHVLEIMENILKSSKVKKELELTTTCVRPGISPIVL
ncbi:MAG: Gfo/Idh/MocA family oxidoreductase [Clostridia bacterium]|nr:Gfo/Idh/MocA family oxidoreductase [Clostridia bacterium]